MIDAAFIKSAHEEGTLLLDYDISTRGSLTLSEFIYRSVKDDILSGALLADDHLPSKRRLAEKLKVSLITVETAYDQLRAEGYVYALQRKGYYVARLPELLHTAAATQRSRASGANLAGERSSCPALDAFGQAFMISAGSAEKGKGSGQEDIIADFTRPAGGASQEICALWSKTLRSTLAHEPEEELYGVFPPQGSLRLRKAIAGYLARARGMAVDPEQVVIGAGSQVLYSLVSMMMTRHCPVAVENPGYRRLMNIYQALGHEVRPIDMDAEGMRFDLLDASDALVAHVMPSHQFPTGKVMTIARRYELLGWAARGTNRYIIEDDYDWEFRFSGLPIPSLQSIDTTGSVIYLSTFSKSLGSALRVAFAVLPERLMKRFKETFSFVSCTVSSIEQVALANLIEGGGYERHLNRYRKQSRQVRDALLAGIAGSAIGGKVSFSEQDSGLHFLMHIESEKSEALIAKDALKSGVKLAPLKDYEMTGTPGVHTGDDRGGNVASFVMQYDGVARARVPAVAAALEKACSSPCC